MNVLVTGATGFIGSYVCRALLALGHSVHAVVEPGASRERLVDVAGSIRWTEIDLFRAVEADLDRLAGNTGMAIHCAWYAVPGAYLTSPLNIPALSGSLNLFSSLWRNGCRRVVGVGTCIEYQMSDRPLDESAPVNPTTIYAAAKLSTYLTGRELARQLNGSFAWTRLFYLYGPQEARARLVPDLAMNLLQNKRVPVTEGRQIRDYLHVEDVASAIVAVATSTVEGPVNIGSGQQLSVREIIATLARFSGGPDLVDYGARPANLMDPPFIVANNTRLVEQTGWKPKYTIETGLANTVEWWKRQLNS